MDRFDRDIWCKCDLSKTPAYTCTKGNGIFYNSLGRTEIKANKDGIVECIGKKCLIYKEMKQ